MRTSGVTSSILVVVSNDEALRHRRHLNLYMGMRAQCNKEKAGDFLSIMPIYSAWLGAHPMRTHRFGGKIKIPATIAIKHQIRMRMAQYEIKKAEAEAS